MQVTYQSGFSANGHRGSRLAGRLKRVLSRFGSGIDNVKVTLKGAGRRQSKKTIAESSCQLQVELVDGGQVLVTGRGRKLNHAIRHSLKRTKHIVAAEMKRRHQKSRQRVRFSEPIEMAS